MNLSERFSAMSTEELDSAIHGGKLTAVELAIARGVMKKKLAEQIPTIPTLQAVEEHITLILDKGTKKQQRDLCTLVGETAEYDQLEDDVKVKIMAIAIEEIPNETLSPIVDKQAQKVSSVKVEKNGKSDQMRKLCDEGHSIKEIAEMTKSHYSFVHGVVSRYKKSK